MFAGKRRKRASDGVRFTCSEIQPLRVAVVVKVEDNSQLGRWESVLLSVAPFGSRVLILALYDMIFILSYHSSHLWIIIIMVINIMMVGIVLKIVSEC